MNEIQVFGEQELIDHIRNGGRYHDHLVSVGSPGRLFARRMPGQKVPGLFKKKFGKILRFAFHDVEKADHLGPMRPRRIARRSDVRRAIRFYRRTRHKASGYTFHCWQGVSRSPAFALGFLYLILGSERAAKEALQRIRPQAMPLQLVVAYFDLELGCSLSEMNALIRQERIEVLKRELCPEEGTLLEELPPANDI